MSKWLQEEIQISSKEKDWGNRAANLRAAKHRLESFAAPMGRMILNVEPVFDVAQTIISRRPNSPEAQDSSSLP